MDPSGLGLGGVKAGAPVDPLSFIKRPTVIIRLSGLVRRGRGGEGEVLSYDSRKHVMLDILLREYKIFVLDWTVPLST